MQNLEAGFTTFRAQRKAALTGNRKIQDMSGAETARKTAIDKTNSNTGGKHDERGNQKAYEERI